MGVCKVGFGITRSVMGTMNVLITLRVMVQSWAVALRLPNSPHPAANGSGCVEREPLLRLLFLQVVPTNQTSWLGAQSQLWTQGAPPSRRPRALLLNRFTVISTALQIEKGMFNEHAFSFV